MCMVIFSIMFLFIKIHTTKMIGLSFPFASLLEKKDWVVQVRLAGAIA